MTETTFLAALRQLTEVVAHGGNITATLQTLADGCRSLTGTRYVVIETHRQAELEHFFIHSGHIPTHLLVDDTLSIDIGVNEQSLGTLYLIDKQGSTQFAENDRHIAAVIADLTATALQNESLVIAERQESRISQQRMRQLTALSNATVAISSELSLDKVLQQIVDSARELIGARYAALGIPNVDGYLDAFVISGMHRDDVALIPHLPHGLGLLGVVTQSDQPIRIDNIAEDPRSVGFPLNHPPMKSFLGAPIVAGDRIIGRLYFTDKMDADAFSADDAELVMMFAAHASVALQNAKLYEQVEQLAVLDERTRIGMDLHDGIIQSIYAMGLVLESTKLVLPEGADEAQRLLDMAVNGLNDSIKDIRNFIMDLRPRRFRGDLALGLAQLVREFQANTLVPVELNINSADLASMSPVVAHAVYLTTQEALANIARHAKASQVEVEITSDSKHIVFSIRDDGRGFDINDNSRRIGHGLANMEARAEELGGRFVLRSTPGSGTIIIMRLPVHPAND